MPSVEMRRTTRVFGARVLRSGRRLFTSPQEAIIRHMRKNAPLAVDDDVEQGPRGGDHDVVDDVFTLNVTRL